METLKNLKSQILSALLSPNQTKLQKLVSIIGILAITRKLIKWIPALIKNILPGADITKRYGKGSYVLITGSTDGIGKSLAFQFAKRGFNIVSMSRTLTKLEKTAEEIKSKYPGIEVVNVQCDFSKATEKGFFEPIWEKTKDLDISILINNVGIDAIELYMDMTDEFVHKMLSINVYTVALLTKLYLKKLSQRKRSAVITMGSLAGKIPMSYFNVYNATKAFTEMFSLCLAKEHTNIDFLSIRPSEVSTGMTHNKPTDIFTITATQCSNSIINELSKGKLESNGHWNHKLQEKLYLSVPEGLYDFVWKHQIVHDFCKERGLEPPRKIR